MASKKRYPIVLIRFDSKGHLWDSYEVPVDVDYHDARRALAERSPHDWTIEATFLRDLSEVSPA